MKICDAILVVLLAPFRFTLAMLKAGWTAIVSRREVVWPSDHPAVVHRREICDKCPHWVALNQSASSRFCTYCGCNLNLHTRLSTKKCPILKW